MPFVDEVGRRSTLSCPPLPSPLHLLAGLVEWEALRIGDRLSALSLAAPLRRARRYLESGKGVLPASDGETVESWLIRNGQSRRLREMLWEPLALAALNQPANEAAAPVFVRVLAQMFGPDPKDSAVAMPLRPLDALYAEPAREFIDARGGEVRTSCPARVRIGDGRVAWVDARGERVEAGVVIVAVPWFASRTPSPATLARWSACSPRSRAVVASPIVTVNLWFDRGVLAGAVRRPAGPRLPVGVRQAPGLRRLRVAPVVRVERRRRRGGAVERGPRVARHGPSWPRRCRLRARRTVLRSVVVRERRATFSLAPGQPPRPDTTDGRPRPAAGGRLDRHRPSGDDRRRRRQRPPRRATGPAVSAGA